MSFVDQPLPDATSDSEDLITSDGNNSGNYCFVSPINTLIRFLFLSSLLAHSLHVLASFIARYNFRPQTTCVFPYSGL
jgi:hypothetical protein